MTSLLHDTHLPLTLSEQLDAMLLGWLEHRATDAGAGADDTATAIVTVGDAHYPEIEAFCSRWDLRIDRVIAARDGRVVVVIAGPTLPVQGLTEITGMYRR
jgi:hypothetical protein